MGLKKDIVLDNGVIVTYHRIISIMKFTNNSNTIEVASYLNKEQRDIEREAIKTGSPMNVLIETTYINKEYDEDETIKDFYDYLKTIDKFKDAEDI